jgi:hypothetical protein
VVVGSSWRGVVVLGGAVLRCGRGGGRGAGAAVHGSSAAAGMAGVRAMKWQRRKKTVLHGEGWLRV